MIIYKDFVFDAAHYLPQVPASHKCRNLHGHTYHLRICIKGHVKEPEGWVLDYGDLKNMVNEVVNQLDHHLLNDLPGLENPTAEVVCLWLWDKLKPVLDGLIRIELKETPTSGVIYEP